MIDDRLMDELKVQAQVQAMEIIMRWHLEMLSERRELPEFAGMMGAGIEQESLAPEGGLENALGREG